MTIYCPAEWPSALAGVPGCPEEVDEVVSLLRPRQQGIAALIAVGLNNAVGLNKAELARRLVITEEL